MAKANLDYREVVEFLSRETASGSDKEARFENFRKALAKLAVREKIDFSASDVILIAGTNGKGTVAKALESLLQRDDCRVGLYTSPHLIEITERIRSHGTDISNEELTDSFETVRDLVEEFSLSHFEILTLIMVDVFFSGRKRSKIDCAILEVGVGGRLDPTRAVPHQTSVITRLGLDHVELLGPTLAHIAAEKLAIIDPGNVVVHASFPPETQEVVSRFRTVASTKWTPAQIYPHRIELHKERPIWILKTPWGEEIRLSLSGLRAVENVSLALEVLRARGVTLVSARSALEQLAWPCRMEGYQIAGFLAPIYLSGDHNPQGVESLVEILAAWPYRNLFVVAGIGRSKNREEMLKALAKLRASSLILTSAPFRATPIEDYGDWLKRALRAEPDSKQALNFALQSATPGDLILVTGSLYLTGDLRGLIRAGQFGCATAIS